jgi:uncharacterized membrane protein
MDTQAQGIDRDGPPAPDRDAWRQFWLRVLRGAGIGALGAGLLFFVAANWQALGLFGRFGLLETLLIVCIGVALWRPPPQITGQSALILATLTTGGLLALFGQSYQTGADVYELFFTWALLALPFALAGGSGALWALWWVILNVALALLCGWLGADHFVWRFVDGRGVGRAALLMLPCVINFVGVAIFTGLARTRFADASPHWLTRLLLSFGFVYGTAACIAAIVATGFWRGGGHGLDGEGLAVLLAFTAICAVIAHLTLRERRDVFPIALMAASAIAISTTWIVKSMRFSDAGGFFLVAFWLIITSSAAGFMLMRWVRTWHTRVARKPREATRPWYIGLLLGTSGWLAGAFMLGFVALLFEPKSALQAGVAGGVLLIAAWGLFRIDRNGAFVSQMALALSIAGQCFVLYAVTRDHHSMVAIAASALVLQTVLVIAMPNSLHRVMSTVFALIAWGWLVRTGLFGEPQWSRGRGAEPSLLAALGGWALAWVPPTIGLWALLRRASAWIDRGWASTLRPLLAGLIIGLAFATLVSQPFESFVSLWGTQPRQDWLALWPLLSAGAALAALAAAFAMHSRALMGACVIAVLLHVSHFYYALGTSLLIKSMLMIALGAALLIGSRVIARLDAKEMS